MTQRMKRRMTISLDSDLAARVEAEAGGNVSAWFNELARRELLAASYRSAAEERAHAGLHSDAHLARYAGRRRAVRTQADERRGPQG